MSIHRSWLLSLLSRWDRSSPDVSTSEPWTCLWSSHKELPTPSDDRGIGWDSHVWKGIRSAIDHEGKTHRSLKECFIPVCPAIVTPLLLRKLKRSTSGALDWMVLNTPNWSRMRFPWGSRPILAPTWGAIFGYASRRMKSILFNSSMFARVRPATLPPMITILKGFLSAIFGAIAVKDTIVLSDIRCRHL